MHHHIDRWRCSLNSKPSQNSIFIHEALILLTKKDKRESDDDIYESAISHTCSLPPAELHNDHVCLIIKQLKPVHRKLIGSPLWFIIILICNKPQTKQRRWNNIFIYFFSNGKMGEKAIYCFDPFPISGAPADCEGRLITLISAACHLTGEDW